MSENQTYTHLPYVSFEKLFDLNGKTAIVTGGSIGIGFAICRRLGEAGAAVIIASANKERGKKAEAELVNDGYKAAFVPTDVRKSDDIDNMVNAAVEQYGSVDILVNNAGIYPLKPLLEIDEAFWDSVFAVNLKAYFFCAQKAGARMIEQDSGGSIIHVSSICGHRPMMNHCTYDTTKGGIYSMTRNMAKDLGQHNIRVNSISPGLTATPGNLDPEMLKTHERMKTLDHITLKRRGEPYEIGNVALFLASSASSYITGTDLLVDGGWATYL